jgi:exodeoxyribonuclease III
MSDGWQGMLFGTVGADADADADADGATGAGVNGELRVCALNVNGPSPARGQRLLDWLLATRCNTLVLTELQPAGGGQAILAGLEAEGFRLTCTAGWKGCRYATAVATRGLDVAAVEPAAFDPRIIAVDLTIGGRTVRMVGVYAPTNGMTADSSTRRRDFQQRLLQHLTAISRPALCVIGDLNVIEPDHRPALPGFEAHDYAFYAGLLDLGLLDAYRTLQPQGGDHSWISARFGSQRLDHALISQAAGTIRECVYDHGPRQKQLSDHAAMLLTMQVDTNP